MANYTLTNLFVDIADAIREKSDTSESIPALEFPDRIREISGGGGGTGENLDTELAEQDDLISQMFEAVAKKTASGGGAYVSIAAPGFAIDDVYAGIYTLS